MKILVISFFDDNFGDMLIRICFDRLMRAALKNLGVSPDACAIDHVHIKDVSEADAAANDAVFFAGGAMIGMNNLSSFENIDLVTSAAERLGVPVVFSSIGINNSRAAEDSGEQLRAVLSRSCVKAMSVREDVSVFSEFTDGCPYAPVKACDPAVWARYLFSDEIKNARRSDSGRVIGINFVRGGLFKANGRDWTLGKLEEYMNALRLAVTEAGADYRFFTNGSVLDNNSLSHFADTYDIPRDKVVYTDSTRELIGSIASCDAVAAIRMHASIISYSLGVPSLNLIWNEKIPHFYAAIGQPELALDPDLTSPAELCEASLKLLDEKRREPDREYMYTLYAFLCGTLRELFGLPDAELFSFETVRGELLSMPADGGEDVTDYRVKLRRARHCYRKLFDKELGERNELRKLKKEMDKAAQREEKLKAKLDAAKAELSEKKAELKAAQKEAKKLQSQLDYIYSKPIVKLYRKMRGADKNN